MLHHKSIAGLPKGKHSDGQGLRFIAKGDGTGRWEVRYSVNGKRRDAGLGTYPAVSLKQAREAATEARAKARKGIDTAKRGAGPETRLVASEGMIVSEALPLFLAARAQNSSTQKLRDHYNNRAWNHVGCKLGNLVLEDLTIDDLINAYGDMWHVQFKTLESVLGTLQGLINWGRRRGLKVDRLLVPDFKDEMGKTIYQKGTHARIDWQEAPAIYAALPENSDAEIATKLHMVVATRINPALSARWADLLTPDGEVADIWTIPRNFMKRVKIEGEEDLPLDQQRAPHVVPITSEVRRLLEKLLKQRIPGGKWVFARHRDGQLEPATQSAAWDVLNKLGANTHSARSCFATWADETRAVERKVVDAVLDHKSLKRGAGAVQLRPVGGSEKGCSNQVGIVFDRFSDCQPCTPPDRK